MYAAVFSLFLGARVFLSALRWRLRWSTWGVTRRWILGALLYVLPPLVVISLRTTALRTSSSLSQPQSLRSLLALLGPRRRSWLAMQPRTDLRLRSPVLRWR